MRRFGRDRHASLLVRVDLARPAEERACGVELPRASLRLLTHQAGHVLELLRCVHRQTPAPALGDEAAFGELVPEPRREDHAPLRVEGVLELPQEHREPSLPPLVHHLPAHEPPGGTTSRHFVAPYTLLHHLASPSLHRHPCRSTPPSRSPRTAPLRFPRGLAPRFARTAGALPGRWRHPGSAARRGWPCEGVREVVSSGGGVAPRSWRRGGRAPTPDRCSRRSPRPRGWRAVRGVGRGGGGRPRR